MKELYLPVVKSLSDRKAPIARIEVGHPHRASHEVFENVFAYDVFGDSLFLAISFKDINPGGLPMPNAVGPAPRTHGIRDYTFNWILIDNIIGIKHSANIDLDLGSRTFKRKEVPPMYTDGMQGWEEINAALNYSIEYALWDMGLRIEKPKKPGEKVETEAPQIPEPGGAPQDDQQKDETGSPLSPVVSSVPEVASPPEKTE